jgi:hypothetical protein
MAPVQADSVVERRLAALEPCSGLKQDALGATLAIDKLDSVTLSHVQLDMSGDLVTLSLQGGLSCKTSDTALLGGNASADVSAVARMRLTDCAITELTITPTSFGGTYASVVKAAWLSLIEPKIAAEARAMLGKACAEFTGSP